MILRFFSRVQSPLDIAVEEAESGEEAIERVKAQPFDVVLTDYRMGAVSGIDVLAFAMVESPETVRILISGYASPELEAEAVAKAHAHALLEKPMTGAELDALLNEQVVERFLINLARR